MTIFELIKLALMGTVLAAAIGLFISAALETVRDAISRWRDHD